VVVINVLAVVIGLWFPSGGALSAYNIIGAFFSSVSPHETGLILGVTLLYPSRNGQAS
jgi:hypothetical protein